MPDRDAPQPETQTAAGLPDLLFFILKSIQKIKRIH